MSKPLRWTILVLLSLSLSACGSLLPRPEALDVYALPTTTMPSQGVAAKALGSLQLRVETPQAAGLVASKRIVIIPDGMRLNVYAGARWDQAAPQMLRDSTVQAFRDSGRLHAVLSDDSNLHADYILSATLDAFQAEKRDQGSVDVVVRYNAMLVRGRNREVIATRQFTIHQPAEGRAVPSVVQAFGQATDQLNTQLVEWVLGQMATAADQSPTRS